MTRSRPPRPLPARVPPLPGESLISLLRRTAEAMGYESPRRLVALLAEQPRHHLNHLTSGPILDQLAGLLLLPRETLFSLTVHRHACSLALVKKGRKQPRTCDSKTLLRYFWSCLPFCPSCLRQDAIRYERLVWSFRPMPVCIQHGCFLVARCPGCRWTFRWDRYDVVQCACGHKVTDAASLPASREVLLLAERFHQVLLGEIPPLPGLSSAAWFWWGERIATAIAKTPSWLDEVGQRLDVPTESHAVDADSTIAWLAAAEVFADWPERLYAFLDAFQQVDKYRTTSTGIGRRFGMLLRQAAWLEDTGYAPPADALREYLLERYSSGHLSGKVCLFQKSKHRSSLRRRAWISQTEASKMLGLRHGAVASLVNRGVLTGKLHPAGARGRSVGLVLRRSVETLRRELDDALDVQTAASRLGIGRRGVLDLIHRGMLGRTVRTVKGWRIPQRSVAELLSLLEELSPGKAQGTRWLSLRQATRTFGPTGLTLGSLLELVRSGKVAARVAEPGKRLNGIVVSHHDLASQSPEIRAKRGEEKGYPLHYLAEILFPSRSVKPHVLKKWIAMGLLHARTSGRACLVSSDEVDRFYAEFCLADEACRILQVSRSTLSRWETEQRIRAVYGKRVTPGAGFSVYRRDDLTHLSRRRRPRRTG